jgi:hypothetical protein
VRAAWLVLAAVSVPLALVAVGRWLWALVQRGPVLYGEGAVAQAALFSRYGLEYGPYPADPIFVAANYPPLYFHLAGLGGDPFVVGRVLSIGATLFVAGAVAYRARGGGRLFAAALAASWLACAPVAIWGAAVKPDLVALVLIVGAVLALDARRAALAGALAALAVWTKPTEGLPAVALLVYLVALDRRSALRFAGAGIVALVVAAAVTHLPDAAMFEHVVTWNALDWHPDQAFLLAVLGLLVAGASLVALGVLRPRDAVGAYAIGALGVVVLGGRDGATINYLLDLLAAAWLAMAGAASVRTSRLLPVAIVAQTLLAILLLDPLGILTGRAISTGAWEAPGRTASLLGIRGVGAIDLGPMLVEDSGLLVATGRFPQVDDLFLWSRLQDRRSDPRLVAAVISGSFIAIVSESDLAHLDTAPLWARQRWHPTLVAAVLERYRLDRSENGLFIYTPR